MASRVITVRTLLDEIAEFLGEAWHSADSSLDVYHVRADCPASLAISYAKRREGTGNRRRCNFCRILSLSS